jgi:hypothetical protein
VKLLASNEHEDRSRLLVSLVSDTTFQGTVVLVLEREAEIAASPPATNAPLGNALPRGIHRCTVVADSIISIQTACIHDCTYISRCYIQPEAVLVKCGSITYNSKSVDDYTLSFTVGPETGGGRTLTLPPEATMVDVGRQLVAPAEAKPPSQVSEGDGFNVIGRHAIIRDTPTVEAVYLHQGASIEAASSVKCTVMFPDACIRNGSVVDCSALQWKCVVEGNSNVTEALLMECASVGPSSAVHSSVLGPDVHVSAGEVHASVLGPNCNAHHQSLVISVLWPTGRGNVGYGANVGSNHTGRLPDQECAAAEGTFFGLSCSIKFPVDLSSAPYTVVAAGTTLPPQRCCMPFSLIVDGKGGTNSILPAWVLRHSPYTLARSEHKFATRRKALRHAGYTGWKIIRNETVQLCVEARRALLQAGKKDLYRSDRDIPGIGANQMRNKDRLVGIQAYTDCIHRFLLHGLLSFLVENRAALTETQLTNEFDPALTQGNGRWYQHIATDDGVTWGVFPWDVDEAATWSYQRSLLVKEFPLRQPSTQWARELLTELIRLENNWADRVYHSKKRDDDRGIKTIPGYADAHVLAEQDPVVVRVRAQADETEETVRTALRDLNRLSQRSRL